MFFLPLTFIFVVIAVLLLPILVLLLEMMVAGSALIKLGISPHGAILIIYSSLVGSLINIPIMVRNFNPAQAAGCLVDYVGLSAADLAGRQIMAVNLGGAVIPVMICIYLLRKSPLLKTFIATIICTIAAYKLAEPVPMVGISLPVFVPPLISAALAILFSPSNPAPVAYISGVLGVLIGADLLNLGCIQGPGILSIGGAGVFDGIFVVGIVSVFLGGLATFKHLNP